MEFFISSKCLFKKVCEFLRSGIVDLAEVGGGDEGDGDCCDAFELHDYVLVALAALDGALDTGKVTVDDADTTAFLVKVVVGLKEQYAVVLTGGYAHEILHLGIGNAEDALVPVVAEVVGHVTHGLELATCHLQLGEDLLGGMDEQQIGDGGNEGALLLALGRQDELIAHGKEILDVQLVKVGLDFLLTTVGDAHGVPVLFARVHRMGVGWGVRQIERDTTKSVWCTGCL